ncbi:MAG: hypothetical protein HZA89_10930 [Verrucomicrobia bacterium]|nr:hypothetical protein [Verrucomicrobiota bacterium]
MKTILSTLWLALAVSLLAQTPPVPSRPVRALTNASPPGPGANTAPRTLPPRYQPTNAPVAPAAPAAPTLPATRPPLPRPFVPTAPPAPPTPTAQTVPSLPSVRVPTVPAAPPALPGAPVNAALAPADPATDAAASTNATDDSIIKAGTIKFLAMPIEQALDFYADLIGRTVLRPASLPQAVITLKTQNDLTYKEAIEALESVFSLNGISTVMVGEKFVTVVGTAQVQQEAAVFNTNRVDTLPESGQYTTRIVQLKYLRPSEVAPAIQPFAKVPTSILSVDANGILILRDNAANIKRMMEIIEKLDVALPLEEELEVVPIKYALASEIAGVLGSLSGGGGGGVVSGGTTSRSPSARGLSGGTGGSRSGPLGVGGAGSLGGYGGSPLGGATPGTTGALPGATGGAAAGASSFSSRLQSLVSRAASPTGAPGSSPPLFGQARIIPDERTNSLLLYGTKEDREQVKKVIAQLDQVQAQVLIEAIILEVSLTDGKNVGVSFGQAAPKKLFGGFSGIGGNNNGGLSTFSSTNLISGSSLPSGFSYFAQGLNWNAALTALANDGSVNVLSRPRIQTSHAVEASLFIGQTVPYVTGTYFGGINGQASSQYQQTQVGITLSVLPLINVDGLVVMDISQNIEQLGTPIKIDNNDVPTTTKRQASAKVAVQDGETIILGGFISSTRSQSKSGVPYLKDVPYLGALFRSKSDNNQRTELVVLMRPTVLKTPQAASAYADGEREKMAGIKRADLELRAEEDALAAKNRAIIEKRSRMEQGKGTLRSPLYDAPTIPPEMLKQMETNAVPKPTTPATGPSPKPAVTPALKPPAATEPHPDTAEPPVPPAPKP